MIINAFISRTHTPFGMTKDKEPRSIQTEVVRDFGRNYRLFIHRRRRRQSEAASNLKKVYAEEVDAVDKHPHTAANAGFS